MKNLKLKLVCTILLLIVVTVSYSQAIKVNSSGLVGINGSPYSSSSYPFKVNGRAYISEDIYLYDDLIFGASSSNYINSIDVIQKASNKGYISFTGNNVKIYSGEDSGGKGLDVHGNLEVYGVVIGSDKKIKKNFKSIDGGYILKKIGNLEGKKYQYKNHSELISEHKNGTIKYSVDTINVLDEAESLALANGDFESKIESLGKNEFKDYIKNKYLKEAQKVFGVSEMINDSMGIVINAPYYSDKEQFGLIAQDVIKEFPELVELDEETGLYSVNYIGFIPILLEAIKAQQEQINELKNDAPDLKSADPVNISPVNANLMQNTPNPFSDQTVIAYTLGEEVNSATLYIYNMNGAQIKSINVDAFKGNGEIIIKANELDAGMYLYTLVADGQEVDTKRMILTD